MTYFSGALIINVNKLLANTLGFIFMQLTFERPHYLSQVGLVCRSLLAPSYICKCCIQVKYVVLLRLVHSWLTAVPMRTIMKKHRVVPFKTLVIYEAFQICLMHFFAKQFD